MNEPAISQVICTITVPKGYVNFEEILIKMILEMIVEQAFC